ncbi:hypothetical protein D3C79_850780 [compost metagenome]
MPTYVASREGEGKIDDELYSVDSGLPAQQGMQPAAIDPILGAPEPQRLKRERRHQRPQSGLVEPDAQRVVALSLW